MRKEELLIYQFTNGSACLGDWLVLRELSINKKIIVELGTDKGLTSILLSKNTKGIIYTIDHNMDNTLKNYLAKFNIKGINYDSSEANRFFDDNSIDMLYIDADHDTEETKKNYDKWFNKVIKKGIILFHDISIVWPNLIEFYNSYIKVDNRIKEITISSILPEYKDLKTVMKIVEKL